MNYNVQLNQLIQNALSEDIGDGDHSTLSCIDEAVTGKAILKIKEDGVLAGMAVAEKIFRFIEPGISFIPFKKDGDTMQFGEMAFEVVAKIHTILKTERFVLNTMQRMSGIATLTKIYTDKLKGYRTKLLDKEAVRIGGGFNHRFGLFDMIMLKDNHIDYCGGIEKAINKANEYVQTVKPGYQIEVETRTLDDVKKVMATGKINRIMLDNFTPALITAALQIIQGEYETEASGGINLGNIESYAATGVDFISSGAIIHQAKSVDLSLKASLPLC
jgi:nicotinate-nucleotide pyrophosphorylase (carboxylating)